MLKVNVFILMAPIASFPCYEQVQRSEVMHESHEMSDIRGSYSCTTEALLGRLHTFLFN